MFSDFCEVTTWVDNLNTNFKSWRRMQELASGKSSAGSTGHLPVGGHGTPAASQSGAAAAKAAAAAAAAAPAAQHSPPDARR
jgi:hypothetical protein